MRNRLIVLATPLLLAAAAGARAQTDTLPARSFGSVDFGARFTDLSGDPARFQRFRDVGDGAFLERFRFDREGQGWALALGADHVGRLDQRYFGEYRSNGKLKLSFGWDQIPLFISRDTRTLFTAESPGVLRLADSLQLGIQNGQLRLADVVGQAAFFDTRSRRDTANFNVLYSPTRALEVKLDVKSTGREGTMPWGATFGFSNDVEVAAPIDTRTTDVRAGVEWAGQRGTLRLGYDGSWFDNHVPTLVWDNPWRSADTTSPPATLGTAVSQGRSALWPSSTLHAVTAAGSFKLPAQSRFTGSLTLGAWHQDEPLLPFTINTAIAVIPLERTTAEAEARTLAMNYTFTSRPARYLWLNARFRYYDFDNRTPPFDEAATYVRLDQAAGQLEHGPEPLGYTRRNLDLDASFTPTPFTALKVGYGRDWTDRTFRIFARTTENVLRASVDSTKIGWLTLRAVYEHAARRGSGFDEEALLEMGEQPDLRHFDVADRDRNRVTGLVQVTPIPALGFSASVAAGKDDYEESGFGLRDNANRAYTVGVDVAPRPGVAAGLTYAFERYTALQNSRNATPGAQFQDPRRDWSLDSADRTHTATASFDLVEVVPRTELRLSYDFTRSRSTYVYGLAAGSTLAAPQQLPPVKNELQSGRADVRVFLRKKTFAVGLLYWYERYRVEDFSLGPETISRIDLPGSLFLGYVFRPYTAHSAWLRLTYLF